jgi:hypothetical protein
VRSGRTPPRRPPRLLRRRMRTTVSPRPSPSISVELPGIVRIQLPVARLLKHQTMQKFGPAWFGPDPSQNQPVHIFFRYPIDRFSTDLQIVKSIGK